MNCRFKAVAASFKESQFLFARLAVQNAHTHTAAVRCSLHTEFLSSASPSAALSGIITSLPHFDTCHSQLGIRSSLWARSRWHPRRQQLPLPVSLLPPPPPQHTSVHIIPLHTASSLDSSKHVDPWRRRMRRRRRVEVGPGCQMVPAGTKRKEMQREGTEEDLCSLNVEVFPDIKSFAILHLLLCAPRQ